MLQTGDYCFLWGIVVDRYVPGFRVYGLLFSDRYLELTEQQSPEEYRLKLGLPEGATWSRRGLTVRFVGRPRLGEEESLTRLSCM